MLTKDQIFSSNIDVVAEKVLQKKTLTAKDRDVSFPKCTVGIDRDGVITELTGKPIRSRLDFALLPGAVEAIAMIRNKGYKVVIIFDQPEIVQGAISVDEVEQMNVYLLELLGQAGCPSIDGIYFCTSADKRDMYSKHNTGMFKKAENELKLSFKGGYYIGDSIEDLECANKVSATPILVHTGNYEKTLTKLDTFAKRKLKPVVRHFSSLLEFAESLS